MPMPWAPPPTCWVISQPSRPGPTRGSPRPQRVTLSLPGVPSDFSASFLKSSLLFPLFSALLHSSTPPSPSAPLRHGLAILFSPPVSPAPSSPFSQRGSSPRPRPRPLPCRGTALWEWMRRSEIPTPSHASCLTFSGLRNASTHAFVLPLK